MQLKNINEFPGNNYALEFLEQIIVKYKFKNIVDLGGGANPILTEDIVRKYSLNYYVFDIDEQELLKAPAWCRCLKIDVASVEADFVPAEMLGSFDLVFSHFLLEHIKGVIQAHRNIAKLLRKNGLAIHFFPSTNNLPLFINKILPERLSKLLVRFFQPKRDQVYQKKFPVYYELCGWQKNTRQIYNALGYTVDAHIAYIGHSYYDRYAFTRLYERLLRRVFVLLQIPFTSTQLLILKKD